MTKLGRLVLTVVPKPMTSFKLKVPMIAAERFFPCGAVYYTVEADVPALE